MRSTDRSLYRAWALENPVGDPFGYGQKLDPVTATLASAGVGLLGSMNSADAAQSAAQTQANAANHAADLTFQQFNTIRNDLAPYRNLGTSVINPLLSAMGYMPTAGSAGSAGASAVTQQAAGAPSVGGSQGAQSVLNALSQVIAGQPNPYGMSPQGIFSTGSTLGNLKNAINIAANAPGVFAGINPQNADQILQQIQSSPNYAQLLSAIQGNGNFNPAAYFSSAPSFSSANAGTGSANTGTGSAVTMGGLVEDPNNILHQGFTFTPGDLTKTPGYQFDLSQGLRQINNSAASQGLGLSGAQLKGAERFATGLADTTYGQQFNRGLTQYQTAYNAAANNVNRLLGLLGVGQSAANQTGAFGTTATANAGNMLTSGANAQAAGTVGAANALSGGLSGIGNNAMLYMMMQNNPMMGSGSLYGNTMPTYMQPSNI